MKYRKKPVRVEAFQMTTERRKDNSEWPTWLHEAWQKEYWEIGAVCPRDLPNSNGADILMVNTPGGFLKEVYWNDWIIKDEKGDLYPCGSDIFEATYEEVEPSW